MKSIIREAVDIVGGWSQVKRGMTEGLPLIAYLAVVYFAACAITH